MNERLALPATHLPQLTIRDPVDPIPEVWFPDAGAPVGPEVVVEQLLHRRRHPGRRVHAIGHVPDGHVLNGAIRPDRMPHAARHFTVAPRHAVGGPASTQRHWSDV